MFEQIDGTGPDDRANRAGCPCRIHGICRGDRTNCISGTSRTHHTSRIRRIHHTSDVADRDGIGNVHGVDDMHGVGEVGG
ncbi:hypothetical protein [Streptomyces sp. NPDC046939]|uniref:hypothetical protein n=1 Tax=Streptomyces sp. NPDC046939 TaxID=3155376 RepID=UPI00340C9EFF